MKGPTPARLVFAVCHLVLLGLLSGCAQRGTWQQTKKGDSEVWRSDLGIWRAEVDPLRGRLTFLGTVGGDNLLLYPPGPPSDLEFGGHRIWLGPQSEWPTAWPAPKNWESQPAASVRVIRGGALEVLSPEARDFPSIRRTYHWSRSGLLICKSSWNEHQLRGRQAIHILQMAEGMTLTAKANKTAKVPRGFVKLPISNRPEIQTHFKSPPHVNRSGNQLEFRRWKTEEKFGFSVQTLIASRPGEELRLHPGKHRGIVTGYPDHGFLTQIYLGSDQWPVTEIEQLSPRLAPKKPGGTVEYSVAMELVKDPARICK